MASRFTGRDYTTLRGEIINFLRQRLPETWDWTNLSDPVVIFAESLARVGDQLNYTIDELRRECDVATAKRASSVYSYAMREGYKMMLPRGSFGVISVNARPAQVLSSQEVLPSQSERLSLSLHKFDEIRVGSTGDTLYVVNDISNCILYEEPTKEYISSLRNYGNNEGKRFDYASYSDTLYHRTAHIDVVLGSKAEYSFTYNDINNDSTVNLPDPIIDRYLVELKVKDVNGETVWDYIDDVISAGFVGNIYTLTPKFVGGAINLCIEFPTNFRDLFSQSTSFTFTYIKVVNSILEEDSSNSVSSSIDLSKYISPSPDHENDIDVDTSGYVVNIGSGIKGYTEYEDATTVRENYKKFVQDYSALLTKDDYTSYLKVATSSPCKVFDHSDNYREGVLPPGTNLIPRVIYVLSNSNYKEREAIWEDLKDRSGRSDCISVIPYGVEPYSIVIKADCFLLGTSVSEIITKIKTELLKYYSGDIGEKTPELSMINYLVHKASDKVIRMDSVIIKDYTYGYIDNTFSEVNNLSNTDVDNLFSALCLKDPENSEFKDEYRKYIMSSFKIGDSIWHYNKYVPISSFIKSFPFIYYIDDGNEIQLETYDEVVQHQLIYGEIDSEDWDKDAVFDLEEYDVQPNEDYESDNQIYDDYGSGVFETASFTASAYSGLCTSKKYIKHHYMAPLLNQVIVLIKAVGN